MSSTSEAVLKSLIGQIKLYEPADPFLDVSKLTYN